MLVVRPRERPSDEPIATIWIERLESRTEKLAAYGEYHLTLSYVSIDADSRDRNGGRFSAVYRPFEQSLSLTGGAVFLDLPRLEGQRLGTFLMHEIVTWAKQWPDANVQSVTLKHGQGKGTAERTRRNRLYEQMGLVFDYSDETHTSGRSQLINAGRLKLVESWRQNIQVFEPLAYLREQAQQSRTASQEIERLSSAFESSREREKVVGAGPIRWALKQHLSKDCVKIGLFALGALAVTLFWFFWSS